MKRLWILLAVSVFALCLVGCRSHETPEEMQPYELQRALERMTDGQFEIPCPRLQSDSQDYSAANDLIRQETETCLNKLLEWDVEGVTIALDYTVTYADDASVCVLFEGSISREGAIHPVNIAFPVCVSLRDVCVMDPSEFVKMDESFWDEFREQLAAQNDGARFSEEQWSEIVAYVNGYSNEELKDMISSRAPGGLVLAEESVIVLLPVPHAIGDNIKVTVPYSW